MPEENQIQIDQTSTPMNNDIRDRLAGLRNFRSEVKLRKAKESQNTMDYDSNRMYEQSLNVNNKELSKKYNMASQSAAVASMIKSHAESLGEDWSDLNTPQDILTEFYTINPSDDVYNKIMEFTQSDRDPEEFGIEMGWIEPIKESFMDKLKGNIITGPMARGVSMLGGLGFGLGEGTWNFLKRVYNNMGDIREIAGDDNKSFIDKYNQILLGEGVLDTVGGGIGDVIGGGIEGAFKGATTQGERNSMSDSVAGFIRKALETDMGEDALAWWNNLTPEEQKEAQDYLTYIDGAMNLSYTSAAKQPIKSGIKGGIKEVGPLIKNVEKGIKEQAEKLTIKNAIKNVSKNKSELSKVADQIGRGKTTDIKNTIASLKEIDTSKVKTFKDLDDAFSQKKKDIAKEIDNILEKSEGRITKEDLSKTRTVEGDYGTVEYKNRSIADAFDDLRKLYETTNDRQGLAELEQMEKYFYEKGFSKKEANDFARTYGNEFKNKAFNKDGSRKVSGVGEGYENTREQIKELVREGLPDDAVKNLDKRYSQISNTQKIVKDTVEEVNRFTRDIKEQGLMGKIGGGLASLISGIDNVTGGLGKGFVQKMAKLAGMASDDAGKMSIDEVERALPKLLKKFRDLNSKIQKADGKEKEIILKQAEKDFAKSSKNWDGLSQEILNNGGITYDLKNNINLGGQDFTSVSPYPNRTLIVPKGQLNDQTVKDYARKNITAIMRDGHALGAWVDKNGDTRLDVAAVIPNKYQNRALELGKKYNQQAVFNLKSLEEIPAGGNGNVIEVDESVVWNDIKDFLK